MKASSLPKEIADDLINALLQGDREKSINATQHALDQGVWCKNSIHRQKPEMKAVCGNRG